MTVRIRCLLVAFAIAFAVALGVPAQARERIRIGIFALSPFMMTMENGSAGGVAADFWRERLAPLLDADIEVSGPYPIPRLEKMLETGEIDVIPYMTKIPARESRFLFPDHPLMTIFSCIVVRRDSPILAINGPEDLFDKKIGFITSAYIPPFLVHDRIKLDLITSTEFRKMNHRKLMSGHVDALLDINQASFVYEMKLLGYFNDIRIIPLKQDKVYIYSLFTKSPKGERLRARFDAVFSRIPEHAFDEIIERYLREKTSE